MVLQYEYITGHERAECQVSTAKPELARPTAPVFISVLKRDVLK